MIRPRLAVTIGDINGIGPEIVVRALASARVRGICRPVVYGARSILDEALKLTGVAFDAGQPDVVEITGVPGTEPGSINGAAGAFAVAAIEQAVADCLNDLVDAVVTAPISKRALELAGSPYPGHTEMLRDLTGADRVLMILADDGMRVCLVTTHVPLADVPRLITREGLVEVLRLAHRSLREDFAVASPKLAVLGLNPHCGEEGRLGHEETTVIAPALQQAGNEGVDVAGPFSPDGFFARYTPGSYDMIVAMYHDQGLIPLKLHSGGEGVNITAGLPIVRTSPEHGTAFDIAWQGRASAASMIHAMETAVRIVAARKASNAEIGT